MSLLANGCSLRHQSTDRKQISTCVMSLLVVRSLMHFGCAMTDQALRKRQYLDSGLGENSWVEMP
jgi:hypothetical protein